MGFKLVAKKLQTTIADDPRPLDRPTWNRVRDLVSLEAIHRDWGVVLYALHRLGQLDNDEREAGDRYTALITDYRKLWRDTMGDIEAYRDQNHEHLEKRSPQTADVEKMLGWVAAADQREESEFELKRAKRISNRYKEARAIAGPINVVLEAMLIDNVWPAWWQYEAISDALTRLSYFLCRGTKREPKKRV